jgi:cytochrome c oxidase subunit 2
MPITVEAVKPEVFAAWVKAKGGTMPGAAPAAAPAAVTANASAPVDNATAAAPETNQTATANSAAAGNTGQ